MRTIALEMAEMLENGTPHSEKALAQIAKELRRLVDENKELKKEKQSILQDYNTAAQVLHGGEYKDVSMLKPLANKAAKVMEELSLLKKQPSSAKGFIVVKEHVWDLEDGGRPELAYLWPAEFNREVFGSFDKSVEFIKEWQLPLGWVSMEITLDTNTNTVRVLRY